MNLAGWMYDPYGALVRHRWMYVTGIVVWVLVAISGIGVAVGNLYGHVPFDRSYWFGVALVFWTGAILIQAGRRRRAAAQRRNADPAISAR